MQEGLIRTQLPQPATPPVPVSSQGETSAPPA
jgi:hypothetical protein